MFRSKREKAIIAELEAAKVIIAAKDAAATEMSTAFHEMVKTVEKVKALPVLVSIERSGRILKFLFARNGQLFEIETYGTLADDVQGWKKALLE